ncbi:LysR substrate-binding domain-containing protein [Sagittula salina]|uniref:LysR family transcriptional regulator n=1 Tax=Sagittula salina TaxID=2820268 RepID=A0A940S5G1_9RHOB|nr:LysR substrate-binding domain-containing protein [Sagittula salina]MBP0484955.1 LysR family transcriptional regulator [Sagittula salina]
MAEMTLRQIEVIRAVMLTGTINGAAAMLHVSAPGISRLVKHTEESLGIRLFERKAGLFVPAMEAARVFDQIRAVYRGVEHLHQAVGALQEGEDVRLAIASAPSVAQFIAARVMQRMRARYADLFIDLNILKIEETVDYLLLERGEFVVMSSPIPNAAMENEQIAEGRLVAIMPDGHPLAARTAVSVHDLIAEPLIGIDPADPYGQLLARPFEREGLTPRHAMRGRFAQTLVSLVRHGLGVAVIDEFSVSEVYMPGVTRRPLAEETSVGVHVVRKKGRVLSGFAEYAIGQFRSELAKAVEDGPWLRAAPPRK